MNTIYQRSSTLMVVNEMKQPKKDSGFDDLTEQDEGKLMKQETKRVYLYQTKCFECGKIIPVYCTLADFGDPPIIKKCRYCNTLYWYTPEDDFYIKPIEEQLDGKHCVRCNADLQKSLVPTHEYIKCCGTEFSLDGDFIYSINLDNDHTIDVEVNLIYR